MDKLLLEKFVREIERQCTFGLIASEDLIQAVRQRDMDRIWYSMQSFLVAWANIVKLFGLNSRSPRSDLVQLLGVDNTSPLATTDARNYFEHFDERLERWFNESPKHKFVDANIGPLDRLIGFDAHDFIRNFDPARMTLTFYGQSQEMGPVITAISQLREKIHTEEERKPLIAQYGLLASGGAYNLSDRIRYRAGEREHTGVIRWKVAPGSSGTEVAADSTLRYIVQRDMDEYGMSQETLQALKAAIDGARKHGILHDAEVVYESAILGKK